MEIIKAYKTSKGIFENKIVAMKKGNRKVDEDMTFYYNQKTREPVEEVLVLKSIVDGSIKYFKLNEIQLDN